MKRTLFILTLIILFTACDEELKYAFVVNNNYQNDIRIQFENYNSYVVDTILNKDTEGEIVYINTGYGKSVNEFELSSLFRYFSVSSDSTISEFNYLSNENWIYREISDTNAEFILEIDSLHFQ